MHYFRKSWLWLSLWAISIVLLLTVPGDVLWARALIIAPAMAGLGLIALAVLKQIGARMAELTLSKINVK
jgi:hypothetical protein